MDDKDITEDGGLPVVDLSADNNRILLALGHGTQAHADLLGKEGACDFDETKIGDIVNDGCAVRIKEHHLGLRLDAGRIH